MALFELHDGGLAPARLGHEAGEAARREALDQVRHHIVEILSAPLFPVCWNDAGTVLTALDPAGQVVAVEVIEELDPSVIVASMAHLATVASAGWADLAKRYPGGLQTFREDWNEFRESMPGRVEPGPRLIIVATRITDSVRSSLAVLATSGVELRLLSVREFSSGRRLVDLQRVEPQVFSQSARLLASRRAARPVIAGDTSVVNEEPEAQGDNVVASTQSTPTPTPDTAQTPVTPAQGIQGGGQAAAPASSLPAPVKSARVAPNPPADQSPDEDIEITLDAPTVSNVGGTTGVSADSPEAAQPAPPTAPSHGDAPTPVEGFTRMSETEATAALQIVGTVLERDTAIVWQRLRRGIFHEATLSPQGVITLADGRTFTDPSAAADAAQGTQDADGWHVWRFGVRGPSLREALDEVTKTQGTEQQATDGAAGAADSRRSRREQR
ncbi:Uncharacterised protein [Actinomyces bovis]|uniref:RAMA domain-containing protein n=1 Tax=Actinomyces bovis TaxID=1658 RepID=A0ABY1VLP7_9ACTO|nr:hypothetical protein [Actinomyces bovis]SPT53026.1 Uncharacterised protein [Actinomyces bovis]VEG55292.1 Uncharacterised protein [Actinomyces israelii]